MSVVNLTGTTIIKPTTSPILSIYGNGNLSGLYKYSYTWITLFGETNSSPVSTINILNATTQIILPPPPHANIINIKIYRTKSNNAQLYYCTTLNSDTFYYNDNIPDINLGNIIPIINTAPTFVSVGGYIVYEMAQCYANINITAGAGILLPLCEYIFIDGNGSVTLPPSSAYYSGIIIHLISNTLNPIIIHPYTSNTINGVNQNLILQPGVKITLCCINNINWAQIQSAFDYSKTLNLTNNMLSTSPTTGALTVTGGVGIGQNIYCAGTIYCNNSAYSVYNIPPTIASYNITILYQYIIANTTTQAQTITLPPAINLCGITITIKRAGVNNVTILPADNNLIDGNTIVVLNTNGNFITLLSDNNNWYIIAK